MDNNPKIDIPQDLVDAIRSLNAMQEQRENEAAAMMYRLICRHEDMRVIDRYADIVLECVMYDSDEAKEDYQNYLNYIAYNYPSLYPEYLKMYNEELAEDEEDEEE